MPVSLPAEPTDKVGYLYNSVRREVEDFFRTTLPIGDFHGVISTATFTQEMYDECKEINRLYATEISRIMLAKADVDKRLPKRRLNTKPSDLTTIERYARLSAASATLRNRRLCQTRSARKKN